MVIYNKPIATSYSAMKSWKFFFEDQEQDKRSNSHCLFNILLKFKPEELGNKNTVIQIGKEEGKLSLFADDMTLYNRIS